MTLKPVTIALVILALIAAGVIASTALMVDEADQYVILQLGNPVRVITNPGLHFKMPAPLQTAVRFDRRILEYDSDPRDVLTQDKKTIVVDNWARWRIADPLVFLQNVRDENGAQARLDDIIYSELRRELGLFTLTEIISTHRETIMANVTQRTNEQAKRYGIEIIDIRIKRADLPVQNEQAVFGRMRSERERQALQYRSEGREQAAVIRARTDMERAIILAEAYRISQEIRGEGDAEATRIYAEGFGRDAEFYAFIRSMEAYQKALAGETTILLSDDSEFLRFLGSSN